MDLRGYDRQKAQAHDALAQGAWSDAEALYEGLADEYHRHGFVDGLLAIQHNRLLAALGAADGPGANRLLGGLMQQLMDAPAESVVARQVADGLGRLFSGAVPGIDHEVAETVRLLAHERTAPRRAVPLGEWTCGRLPDADALASVSAPVSAALLAAAVRLTWGQPDAPVWLKGARSVLGPTGSAGELPGAEAAARDAWRRGEVLKQYPAVVSALEVALMASTAQATVWSLALAAIEQAPLPDRLDYLPGLPREAGLRARADLHGRIAAALEQVAGAEHLSALHWAEVRTLLTDWWARVDARTQRGSGRAADVEAEAEMALLAAAAWRAAGDLPHAHAQVSASLERTRRDALRGATLRVEVRLLAAELAERAGRREAAAPLYREAAQQSLPIMVEPSPADERLAAIDARVLAGEGHLVLAAARALAGLRRTAEAVPVGLEAARDAIAQARPACRPEAVAWSLLEVELTGAREGDAEAAVRAIEAARRLSQPEAALVAALTLGEGDLTVDRLATLAREAAAGPARQLAEVRLADRLRTSGDQSRADAYLRQLADTFGCPLRPLGRGRWDHLLGAVGAVDPCHLVAEARPATARRLLWGWRRRQGGWFDRTRFLGDGAVVAAMDALRRHLAAGAEGPLPLDDELDELTLCAPTGARLTEARLEYAVLDEAVFGCLSTEAGPVIHRLSLDRRSLGDRVSRVQGLLDDGDHGPALGRAATALGEAALGPFADALASLDRVVISAFGAFAHPPGGGLFGDALQWVMTRPGKGARAPRVSAGDVLRVLGDDVTASELRLASDPRLTAELRHGADLAASALSATLQGARVVYLVGRIHAQGVSLSADGPPIGFAQLADALRDAQVEGLMIAGPVVGRPGRQLIDVCLGAVPVVVARRRVIDDSCDAAAMIASQMMATPAGESMAWAAAEGLQAALRAGAAGWPAYEVFVAED